MALFSDIDAQNAGVSQGKVDTLNVTGAGASLAVSGKTATITVPGGASGDSITVNGAAVVDADFDDATPAPPASTINVAWQKDAASPANISANVPFGTTSAKGVVELATDGESAANVVVQGNDARMSNARTPTAHATSHKTGGSDSIKLDEFSAPDDNTNLNVSTSTHGLTPKLPNDATKYLDGTGAYTVPPGTGGTIDLTVVNGSTTKKKSANESITSSAALQDDDDFQFSVVSGRTYTLIGRIHISDGGGGMRYAFDGPSMTEWNHVGIFSDASSIATFSDGYADANVRTVATAVKFNLLMFASFVPSATGTVKFRWAQNISNVSATTLLQRSFMTVLRVA